MNDTGTPEPGAQAPVLSEATAGLLWTASSDGLLLVGADGTIAATNAALDHLLGYDRGALVGRSIEDLVPPELRSGHAALRRGFEEAPAARPMAASRLLEALRADGTRLPVNVSLGRLPTDQGELSLAAVRDLTDRVLAEAQAAEADRRRFLAEDHDRIASDLHDTVIQRLFALGLGLQSLMSSVTDPEVELRLASTVDTVDEIIAEIRDTIFGLRHSRTVTGVGLRQVVLGVVTDAEAALGFAPDVRFSGPVDGIEGPELLAQIVPVVREALSNVARHAGASTAMVSVAVRGERLEVVVEDDGRGLPEGAARRSGLANLADRALSLDGELELGVRPEGGTRLRWAVPAP